MTSRVEVVWIDTQSPEPEILAELAASGHSRFPVMDVASQEVVGVVQAKDLLQSLAANGSIDLSKTMRKPVFVPETLSVAKLLDALSGSDVRMAIVVDEHGEFDGIATAADILGAIAGSEAFSPMDRIDAAVRRADGSWLIDGLTPIQDFERLLGVAGLVDARNYATVAGLIVQALQRIAQTGDIVEVHGIRFEVADMDGRRIDRVIASVMGGDAESGADI